MQSVATTAIHWSELAKNLVECLALVGALWILYTWKRTRQDRAADILLRLEECFGTLEIRNAREWITMDDRYEDLKVALKAAMADGECSVEQDKQRSDVDELLRFYVVLMGIHSANQVPLDSLKACYRFWLSYYFSKEHGDLTKYVDMYYPTLSGWLAADKKLPEAKRFCTPDEFFKTSQSDSTDRAQLAG